MEEKIRWVISMPVATFAALVMLAGFDSAACPEHPALQPDGMLLE